MKLALRLSPLKYVCLLAPLALGQPRAASAANLSWDPAQDQSNSGGAGIWDISSLFWNDDNIAPNVLWNNAGLDTAVFGGTGGAVSLSVPITAGGLTFNAAGYSLSGSALTLAGGATVNAGFNASISSVINGSAGLVKSGVGTLTLSGANTYTGGTTINAGDVSVAYTNGQTPLGVDAISLSGATLTLTPTANTGTVGLSGRQFTTSATISDTARLDFTGTANLLRTDGTFTLTHANNLAAPVGVQWTGKINITTGGAYTFAVGSDDGSRLFIDGVLVVQNDGPKGVADGTSAAINLSSGLHDVRIDFTNSGGNGNMNFKYSGPDQVAMGTVPSSKLSAAEVVTLAGASNAVILGSGIGNALNVSGNSTIALQGGAFTQTQLGNATFANGSTLALTTTAGQNGKALRLGGTATFGDSVTLNLAGDGVNGANLYIDGALSDGGAARTITKIGAGSLYLGQTSVANSLVAGTVLDVGAGTLVLTGSSATGAQNPIGAASVKLSGGNLVLDSKIGSATVATLFNNSVDVTQNASIQAISTGGSLTTLGGSGKTLNIAAGKTLILDAIAGGNPVGSLGAVLNVAAGLTGSGNITTASTKVGTLAIAPVNGIVSLSGNNAGYTGTVTVPVGTTLQLSNASLPNAGLNLAGTLNLFTDGNGSAAPETISFGATPVLTGASTIAVNRLGTTFAPLFTTAANKTAQIASLTTGGFGLTVNNGSGYGLAVSGVTTLSGTESFTVGTASTSAPLVVQGLSLNGKVTGTAAGGITKAGAGTMVLNNNTSDFTGNLTVTGGVLGATSDTALGNAANTIILNGAPAAFEAFDSFATSRNFTFSNVTNSNNLLLVANGKTLTINTALTGANGFQKGDPGVLVLTNNASTISGGIIASGGILRITSAGALGATSGLSVAGNEGTAFQLDGSGGAINFARPISLAATTGIQNNGAIENFAGNNTVSGAITLTGGATIGNSAAGTTLILTGGISGAQGLTFNGVGDTTITTTALGAVSGLARNGSGTTTIAVASPLFVAATATNGGTLVINGAGSVGNGTAASTVTSGGTLWIDDSGTANATRFGSTRTVNLSSGTFRYTANGTAASTQAVGALTSTWGGNTIRVDNAGAGNSTLTFASLAGNAVSGGSTLVFQSNAAGTGSLFGSNPNKVVFTTAPTLTNSIIQRALVFDSTGGSPTYNFATHGANGITAFTAYNATNNVVSALATDTMRLTASANTTASRTLNAIASSGAGIVLNGTSQQTLTLTAANVLVQSGDLTIGSNLVLAAGGVEIGLNVAPGATLNVNAPMTNSNNITTGLGGTINLNTRQYFNTAGNYLTINGGTVKLNGGNGTLFAGQTTGANQNLAVGPGGTLDLNGTSQTAGDLRSPNNNNFFGSGGIVTSTGGAATLVSRQANANWGGQITGPVTFVMGNNVLGNVERFYQDNTYTGRTLVTGGTLELTDAGRLSGTSAIDINQGVLNILNTSAQNGRFNLTDRVPNATPINLSGGAILFSGRAQTQSSETLGTVTLVRGNSNLNLTAGGTGINSSDLTITNLVQGSPDAVTNVQGATGQAGSTTRLFFGNGTAMLSNNILPTWIQAGGTEFMSYNSTMGAMALSAVGAPGYDGTTLPTVNSLATAVGNYRIGASGVVPAGGLTVNTLNINGAFNVTFGTGTDVLNIGASGLMKSGATGTAIGSVVDEGRLTAGGASPVGTVPLYLYNAVNGSSFTINSRVIDNGASPVRLVVNNFNGGTTVLTSPNNSYTGGTVVNGWVNNSGGGLSVTGSGLIPAGGVTVNNSTLVTSAAGQIHSSNDVTIGGSSTLTLVGNNTLASLTVDNYGGIANPTVNTGGVLSLTGGITASSSNVSTLPVINGTLDFGGTGRTFAINPISYNGVTLNALQPTMNIAGVIQNAGLITKTGNGLLQLSGQSTFTGGINLTAGGLVLGASSTPTSGAPLSGPLGTGTLTTAAGTTLLSTAAVNLANDLTIQGNLNFDGLNSINFNGTTTLPASPLTINVAAPQQTVGLLGTFVNPTTNITKTGYGTLNLSTSYLGTLTLPGGGAFSLLDDGDGTGALEILPAGLSVATTGATILTVGRTGVDFAPYYPQAVNKTIQIANLNTNGGALTVNNNNGYGLEITGTQTFTGGDQIYNVATASGSNVVQGLTLSGKVTGAFNLIKQGTGTLVLNNITNDFGGAGKVIDIQGGVVAANSDAVLGNSSNGILLNANATTGVGFRATGSFSTSRTITLGQAANGIEVVGGSTLTLNSAFAGTNATTQLVKNDAGVLELNAANPGTWTGSITAPSTSVVQTVTGGLLVNQGIVRISNASALGATTNIIAVNSTTGAAVQIAGGINVPNPIVLNTLTTNAYAGGINWGGGLQSIGNGVTNTWSGAISNNQDAGITADAGNTLNLTGGINQNAHITVYGGAGNINVTTNPITLVHSLDKIGSGTVNIQVATAAPTGNGIRVFAGNLTFSGAGAVSGAGTVTTSILPGGTLNLDNAGTVTPNRLGGRSLTMTGGNLNLIGGASVTNEAIGAPIFNRGQSTITVTSGVGGANLTFTAASNNVAPAQTTAGTGATALFRGTSLGTAAGPGVSSIQWTAGGLLFHGQTGATGSTNKGIVPWAIIDTTANGLGTSFVTGDAAAAATNTVAILRPLAAGEYASGALAANNNMLVTTALTAQPTVTPNSLTIDTGGSIAIGSGVSGTAPIVGNTLTLSSGGILVRNGVTSSISGGILAQPPANSPWNIHTIGTADLTISSTLSGGQANSNLGLMKAGNGILTLSTPTSTIPGLAGLSANTLNMQTAVNQGTLKLNGGTNTLGANNFLEVGAGATLDLNGTSQFVLGLYTDGSYNGIADTVTSGGTVTNTSATMATLVTNSDGRNWSGQITGNVFYNRTGTGTTTTIYTPQTYTGGTLINGGAISLRDYGKLTGTSDISVNYASLTLDNTQAAGITGRLGSAPITLRSATFTYAGRAATASTETVGAISLAQGWSNIVVSAGGTGINSADLTIPSLSRPAGSSAVVNLAQGNGSPAQTGQLGSAPRLLITAPSLTNNLLGPWAVASREWASYNPTLGTGKLNDPGFAGYSASSLAAATATENIRIANVNTTLTADAIANTLNFQFNGNQTIDLGIKKLTLAGGGLLLATGSDNFTGSVNNGTITSGFANGAVNDLYVYHLPYAGNNRQSAIGAVVADNGATPVRLILSSSEGVGSGNRLTLNGLNTYSGGTVVNQGTVVVGATGTIPAGGITLNGGALSQAIAGQATPGAIAAANVVTINGTGVLNLSGANTLAGLVFNNLGGTSSPTVNTFVAGAGTDGRGTLTIGASGIVADSSNVQTTSLIAGRLDMGASANTITVNPITVNGASVSPLQAALAIQGWTGSAGGITKTGNGVLQLNAQSNFTGTLNVAAGGINFGTLGNTGLAAGNAAGSRYAQINLATNTWLNLSNTDATIGSLAGSGNVINTNTNSSALPGGRTFNVGFDNTDTTFSGSFARWSDAFLNPFQVNKIGTGTMTLTGVSSTTNTLQVAQGGVTFSGASGSGVFATNIVLPTGTLTLDNSAANLNNRLGGTASAGTLAISGGEFKIIGNAAAPTTETIGTFNINAGQGNPIGGSVITLQANAAQPLTFTVGATFGGLAGSSSLIRGISGTAGNGNANFSIGALGLGAPTGAGTGANGTTTMPIRPDILGDASATGFGTAFITKDSATNFLRPLTAAEMATSVTSGANNSTVNFGLSSVASIGAGGQFGSLTLNSGGGLQSFVTSSTLDGLPINSQIVSGGILAFAGNTDITVGRLQTANNVRFYFHTIGDLTVNSVLNGTTGGLVKADAGKLTLGAKALYTGQTNVNGGTLILNGGDNTLPVLATGGAPTLSATSVSGGTVDLNGNNQLIGTLFNNGGARYDSTGGTFTNSAGGAAVNLSTNLGSAQVFGGVIAGNLNLQKTGNNALSLASPNTFTGSTNIRANTLNLIDAGTLSNTSAVNLFYAGLNIDHSGLNPVGNINPTRVAAATSINLSGSTLTLTSGGSMDSTATFNTVNLLQAHSTISVPQAPVGASSALTIGNLVRAGNLDATINLTGGAGGFFSNNPGLNQSNLYINSIDGTPIPATIPGKILGGWALANNGEFVTYISPTTTGANGLNFGVVTMNGTTGPLGTITQTAYDTAVVTAAGTATTNVRITASATLVAGGTTFNSLASRGAAATTITFAAATDRLNLASGGLALTANQTQLVGATVGSGLLSAGVAAGTNRLYVYSTGATTINSIVSDNANVAGAVTRLVLTPMNSTLTLAAVNTYTGGTVVNGGGGAVSLTSASSAIPAGGLTLNNVAVTSTVAGNIVSTNDVTLNGGATLTLTGANTLNSLSFNNNGGTGNPGVVIGTTSLTLSATNAITSVNDNLATVPTISGTLLTLPAGANISTSTTVGVPTGLVISAPIASTGAINKVNTGSLLLSGASTFAGGVNLNAGTIILGANSTPTTGAVTSGPLGTGTLTMADGTALISDSAVRIIANAVALNGNITFGSTAGIANASTVAANGVTLNGTVNLGSSTRTINVNSFLNTSTIGGIISGSAGTGLTKAGPGTLILTGVNTYDGGTNINAGVLQSNTTGLGSAGNITFGGGILQHAAATPTDFSARFSTVNNQPFYIDTNNQAITYASPLTSATGGSLGKFGAGTLILTNTATYDGVTLINAGTLQVGTGGTAGDIPSASNISNNGALTWNRSDDDSLTGVISGAGSLTKFGNGVLTLTNANSFTGNVTVGQSGSNQGGALKITNSLGLGVGPKTVTIISNNVPVGNQAQLLLDGGSGPVTLAPNISFTTSQASTTQPAIVNVAGNNVINGNFTLTSGGGSTSIASDAGDLTLNGSFTPNTNGRQLILLGAATGTVNGVIDGIGANALTVIKQGNGTWTLTNSNLYTGPTTISGGTLSVGLLANGGTASGIGASTNGIANLVLDGGTLRYTGATVSTDRNFTITAAKTGTINVSNAAANLTVSGAAAATTGELVKSGPGTLTFTAPQLNTGATTINAGTLALTGSGSVEDTAPVNVNGAGSSFDISGITAAGETVGSLSGTATTGAVVLGSKALTVGGNNTSTTYAGVISGTGSLIKTGTGNMTLTNTSLYTGATDVNTGILTVNGNISSSSMTTINTGATLAGSGVLGPVTSLGGNISPGNSPGILTTGNLNTSAGVTTFNMELNGTAPGTGYDQVVVNGLIDIGTTSVLSLTSNFVPTPGDKFFLLVNNGSSPITGLFSGIADNSQFTTVEGYVFEAHYTADSGTGNVSGGNDFALLTIVPEPSGTVLLALTFVFGVARRRRK